MSPRRPRCRGLRQRRARPGRLAAAGGRANRRRCCARGSALVELLVASLLASLVLGAAVGLLRAHVALARRVQAELGAVGDVAWALGVAARDVELAGADPARAGVIGIGAATADRVTLEADLDGNGAIDGASAERLGLSWSPTSGGRLIRRVGGQSTSIAASVPSGGFALRYFDGRGVELPAGGSGLDPAACEQVRLVRLELAVRDPLSGAETRTRTEAALRSRLGGP